MAEIDKEKVIKAAEICLRYIEDGDCPIECPYFVLCTLSEERILFQPLIRDALSLLKEHEAQFVLNIGQQISCKSGSCPKCGKMLNTTCNKNFCGDCGQAVKWNG